MAGKNKVEVLLTARDQASAKVRGLSDSLTSLKGIAITAFAGWGISEIVSESLNAFSAFDKGLIGIQKTTNMTDQQMVVMGESIKKMASEIPVATTGLLEIAEAAGQLGVTGVKNVALFTETLAKMQIASDVVGAEGAKSLARLLNTANEATEGVKVLGSVIVSLGNQMAASEAEIVHMASEIGRGTAAFNISSAASVAYGAALKAMGARAELSGSAITRSMIEIEKAIISGGEKFLYLQKVTGMTGEVIERVFKEDSSIVFNAFIKGAHEMTEEGISAITILERFGLTGTEVIKGLTPLIKNVEQLEKAFAIANKEVKNATALDIEAMRASSSFSAQMRMTKNVVDEIAAGIGKGLAPKIVEITQNFRDWVEQNEKFINQDVPAKIGAITTKVKTLIDTFNKVPKEIVGVGGAGLIGALFFGGKAGLVIAGITSAIILADKLSDKIAEAIIPAKDLADAWVEIHTAQGILLVRQDEIDNYFLSLNKGAETVKELGDNANKTFAGMQQDADKANKELEKFYKLMEKSKVAMDQVTLAAMPEYGRGIEEIIRKYAAWNKAIKENAEQAGYSADEIVLLYANLGLRMDEEIEDYVKSHEKGNEEIYDLWQHTYEKMTDILADFFRTGKFHISNFVDFFLDELSRMGAAWVMGNQSGGGFSFANMFGGMFGGGGGTAQPGTSGIQQGIQGASSAWSLNQAYGAYTTAGGGWAGAKAGGGSFFGGGVSAGGGVGATLSAIPWTWWAAGIVIAADYFAKLNVKKGYGEVEGTPQGYRTPYQPTNAFGLDFATDPFGTWLTGTLGFDEPMAGNYLDAAIARSDWGTAFKAIPATILEWSSPVLTLLGRWAGIDMGKIFGFSNKKRSYYGGTYGFQDYSSDEGWGVSDWSHEWRDKRKGKKAFGGTGEGMAETGRDLMNALDSMFKSLLSTFDTTYVDSFTTAMAMLSAEMVPVTEATKGYYNLLEQGITEVPKMSFGYYISAEDEGEFEDDWRESWARMTKNIIDPIVDIGTDLLSQALDSTVTDSTAWNYFTDDMQDYLKKGLESGLEGLKVDWSTVTDQESFEAALEQMGLAVEDITAIMEYFDTVGAILEHITTTIDMHGFSDSVKSAVSNLASIKTEFMSLAATLVSTGIDLEKYTDLQTAYNMAIQDWIEKAFVGAISYAGTSAGWRTMAPQAMSSTDQWIQQYQHIQDLAAAQDGTTASAIELSDALGILSGMSYDLAAEMQSAIASIHESYSSAIESMYLETLSDQSKYDYYKAQASASYDLMMSATSVEAIRAYAADILQYSQGAYGLMSDEQKQQYFSQYQDFLLDVETASTNRIEVLGDTMDTANQKLIDQLTPLLVNTVTDIQNAAVLISSGGADVAAGGADIVDAANTPITVNVNLDSGEVG